MTVDNLIKAVTKLSPEAKFWVTPDNVVHWVEGSVQVSDADIQAELSRMQAEVDAVAYKDQRAAEYPSMADYLDGIVKGDQAQVQAYIDACLAVKAKYPKPTP
jgi:hypothetical protein